MYGSSECCGNRSQLVPTFAGYDYPDPETTRRLSGWADAAREALVGGVVGAASGAAAGALRGHPGHGELGQGWEAAAIAAGTELLGGLFGGGAPLVDPQTRCPGMPPPEEIEAIWSRMPPERRQYHLARFRVNNRGMGPENVQHLWSGAYGGTDCVNRGDPAWLEDIKRDEQQFGSAAAGGAMTVDPSRAGPGAAPPPWGKLVPLVLGLGILGAVVHAYGDA